MCELCRYSSRALLIPFQEPSLKPTTKEERSSYQKLLDLLEVLSSSAGAVISMGKRFVEDHQEVILHYFEPKVSEMITDAPVLHRMHIAYSTLLYFTTLVSNIYFYMQLLLEDVDCRPIGRYMC